MSQYREQAYTDVINTLKGPKPVGSIDYAITQRERVLELEARVMNLEETLEVDTCKLAKIISELERRCLIAERALCNDCVMPDKVVPGLLACAEQDLIGEGKIPQIEVKK